MRRILFLLCLLPVLGAAPAIEDVPVPTPRPEEQDSEAAPAEKSGDGDEEEEEKRNSEADSPPLVAPEADPKCVSELKRLGAAFEEVEPVTGTGGCGFTHAVRLTGLAPAVKVEPPATVRCETALALARWLDSEVLPGVEALGIDAEKRNEKPPRLTAVRNASAYVCRRRNNQATGKLSEHAIGAAIDISAFVFEDGSDIVVEPRADDHTREGAFQQAVAGGACLYFSTVLGPRSDSFHSDHLHLDIAARKGGYRICQ